MTLLLWLQEDEMEEVRREMREMKLQMKAMQEAIKQQDKDEEEILQQVEKIKSDQESKVSTTPLPQ